MSTETTNSRSGAAPLEVIMLLFMAARRTRMDVLKGVRAVASTSQNKMKQ
jgi:hypothetical protein